MWICASSAFLSIVADRHNKYRLLVRARMPGHIEAVFPKAVIFTDAGADYFYRAFVSRKEVANTISDAIVEIDYDNFKGSVGDSVLHDAYMKFWQVMHSVQQLARWAPQTSKKKAKTFLLQKVL